MGRSFYTVPQQKATEPQIASTNQQDATVDPEMSTYCKVWSPKDSFDPDSDEFFANAVYEAFLPPPSPMSPMSPASLSSEAASDRASSRDLSPPLFRDISMESQPSGIVSGEAQHGHDAPPRPRRFIHRMSTGGLAPRRLTDSATRTYRPLARVPTPDTEDSDDEHENQPAQLELSVPAPFTRLRTSSINPIPLPSATSRPTPTPHFGNLREEPTLEHHSSSHLAPPELPASMVQPVTPPQALRELFASEPISIPRTPHHRQNSYSAQVTPGYAGSPGLLMDPSPPPSVTPRLYSWTSADALPSLRVPESPSAGRERDREVGRDRSASLVSGSPSARGLRTVNGVRNARWPVY